MSEQQPDFREIQYQMWSYQERFHNSTKPKVLLSGGYGSGKTYALIMKGFQLMAENEGLPGGLLAPTIQMMKRDVIPTIEEICYDNEIPFDFNKSDKVWYFPDTGTTLYGFHSQDEGKSIRGPNLAFGLINEITICSKPAFDAFIARVRLKKARLKQVAGSGTPEGFNWVYDYFIEKPREDTDVFFGDMRENKEISADYYKMLCESYDEKMVEQYVQGKFVNMAGNRAAWSFDRHRHTSSEVERVKDAPVWVTLDFNVSPMAATFWNKFEPTNEKYKGKVLTAFKDIQIQNSNTYEMADAILAEVDLNKEKVVIFPDPAGGSRSTKTELEQSDIDILKKKGFTDIRYKSRLSVKDCLNSMNGVLDKDRILINHMTCPNLVADLEQCIIKPGTNFEIDKSNKKRTHWLDGMKNMLDYEFPIDTTRGARVWKYR